MVYSLLVVNSSIGPKHSDFRLAHEITIDHLSLVEACQQLGKAKLGTSWPPIEKHMVN